MTKAQDSAKTGSKVSSWFFERKLPSKSRHGEVAHPVSRSEKLKPCYYKAIAKVGAGVQQNCSNEALAGATAALRHNSGDLLFQERLAAITDHHLEVDRRDVSAFRQTGSRPDLNRQHLHHRMIDQHAQS